MRMIDVKCPECGTVKVDVLLREKDSQGEYIYPDCGQCGTIVERVHLQGAEGGTHGVVADSIPGGIYIKNMLCHADGTPRRFDSHSDIRAAAKHVGALNYVRHQGGRGTDKSKNTQRFV